MNDDELKELWQRQPLREPDPSSAQMISAMQKKTSQLRFILQARDFRELAACAVVIVVFTGFAFFSHSHQPISRLGDWIVVASSCYIAWKLIYTRWTTPSAPPGATVVEALRAELNSVRAQSRLLGSVLWWYLLPGFVGLLVMTWGGLPIHDPAAMLAAIPGNILMTFFFIAVDVFIYWLNQKERVDRLLPLESQLESLLRSAETGDPLDNTQIADLRPIAISMAAADQVDPVEFKVAFWQVALWGEIGFIGIWFFLIVALTLGDKNPTTTKQTRDSIPPSVGIEATDHYAAVTREIVDLLNRNDYAGVQKLFNASMSDALPPQRATDFFTNLTARFGNIESFNGPTGGGYEGWTAFRLHCQRGELIMSLALDANNSIAGIHFQPSLGDSVNFDAFIPRLFSTLHVALIVPFFLLGLLYSWFLQKLTERAVGISNLGVHLNKGLDLILWSEIKEIRPLKILNIRSLWLIKESGEKTIMPWSSLERQSDLKAAVDRFAPADHPIRQCFSLLRRT